MIKNKKALNISLIALAFTICSCKSTKNEVVTESEKTTMRSEANTSERTKSMKEKQDAFRKQRSQLLFDKVNMNPEQQTKYFAIQDKYKPKMDKIRASAKDKKEMIEKVSALRTKQEKDIMAILSAEQKIAYTKFLEEPRKKKSGNRPH